MLAARCVPASPARARQSSGSSDVSACSRRNSSVVSTRAFVVIRLTRQWRYIRAIRKSLITWFASAIGGLNATTFCFALPDRIGIARRQLGPAAGVSRRSDR